MNIDLSFAEKTYTPKGAIDDKQSNKLPQLYFSSRAKNKRIRKLFNIANLIDKNYTLSVGWFAGDKYPSNSYDFPYEVGEVAKYQEYGGSGTWKIRGKEEKISAPPRPFVRPAMAHNRQKWRKQIFDDIKNVLKTDKNRGLEYCFARLGKTVVEDIQYEIKVKQSPPLSERTINRRIRRRGDMTSPTGFYGDLEKPLIDTGRMLNSCKYNVKKG